MAEKDDQKFLRMTSHARVNKDTAEKGMGQAMKVAAEDFARIIVAERAFALAAIDKGNYYDVEIIAHVIVPPKTVALKGAK